MKTADRKPSRIMPESTAKNISAKKYLPASTAKPTHQPSPVGKTHACSKAVSAFCLNMARAGAARLKSRTIIFTVPLRKKHQMPDPGEPFRPGDRLDSPPKPLLS